MKNKIYRVIRNFRLFLGLAVTGVQAQAPSKVEVDIPFEFSAGKTTLARGRVQNQAHVREPCDSAQ